MSPPAVIVAEGIGEIELVAVGEAADVPPGGTIGQVLSKIGSLDYQIGWEDATGGTGGGITTEQAVDATAAAFAAGTHTNVTVTYNDAANSISLAATGGGGGITVEDALDAVQTAMTGTAPIVVTKSDPSNTIVVSASTFGTAAAGVVPASGGGTSNYLRADGTWAPPAGGGAGITTEDALDAVQAAMSGTSPIVVTSSDAGNTIVVSAPTAETQSGAQAKVDTHVNDTTAAHAASAVAFTPTSGIAATNVQAAIVESVTDASNTLATGLSGKADSSSLLAHVDDTTAAHVASSIGFTATGTIAATNVQAAIAELGTEKVQNISGVTGIWTGNQAAYDALGTWSSTVLYVIA